MTLKEINAVDRFIPREHLTEVVQYTELIKRYEKDYDTNDKIVQIRIKKSLFDYVITAVRELDRIGYFDSDFINEVEFKIK